eukprot:1282308-Rhodomonas_salina.4
MQGRNAVQRTAGDHGRDEHHAFLGDWHVEAAQVDADHRCGRGRGAICGVENRPGRAVEDPAAAQRARGCAATWVHELYCGSLRFYQLGTDTSCAATS